MKHKIIDAKKNFNVKIKKVFEKIYKEQWENCKRYSLLIKVVQWYPTYDIKHYRLVLSLVVKFVSNNIKFILSSLT